MTVVVRPLSLIGEGDLSIYKERVPQCPCLRGGQGLGAQESELSLWEHNKNLPTNMCRSRMSDPVGLTAEPQPFSAP